MRRNRSHEQLSHLALAPAASASASASPLRSMILSASAQRLDQLEGGTFDGFDPDADQRPLLPRSPSSPPPSSSSSASASSPVASLSAQTCRDDTASASSSGRADLTMSQTFYSLSGPPVGHSQALVVCIHGMTLASYIFDDLVNDLVAVGGDAGGGTGGVAVDDESVGSGSTRPGAGSATMVLTYDLCGRGQSTLSPATRVCDVQLFVNQLAELLVWLGLVGSGSGGSSGSGISGGDAYGTTNPRMRSRVSSQAVLPIVLVGTSLGGAIAAAFTAAYPSEVSRLVLVAPA